MPALLVATAGPYNLMLLLGLLLALAIAWQQGRRAGAPALAWAVVLALTITGGVVGARLLHFDGAWATGGKTILGALLLGTLVLFGAVRFLRVEPRSVDALALAIPLGFALGRIGCLLAGCCHGEPTGLPWGALYDVDSPAFRAQLAAGLIGHDATAPLPVHPTQLYEAGLGLLAAAAVPRLRRAVRRPGSLLLAVLLTLMAGRILLETFRARAAAQYLGMTQVQWAIVALACVTALLLWTRERRTRAADARGAAARRLALAGLLPPLLIALGAGFFSPLELLVLALAAAVPLVVLIARALAGQPRVHLAEGMPVLLPGVLLLAVLQVPADTADRQGDDPQSEWVMSFSFSAARELENRFLGEVTDECGTREIRAPYEVDRKVAGLTLTRTSRPQPGRSTAFRLRGFAGTESAVRTDEGAPRQEENTTLLGAGLSLTSDWDWLALTGGGALGTFTGEEDAPPFAVIAGVRLFPETGPHIFAGANDVDPLARGGSVLRAGAGYGFPNGTVLRAGIWRDAAPFVGATLTPGAFVIEPTAVFGDEYDIRLSVGHRFGADRSR